ncbi:MAG: MTH1187 family thiamine-binding protein [Bacteroidota bacterium]|nr:MTH1187 family thiamine-binding protein [Bacteroidota bacterium]
MSILVNFAIFPTDKGISVSEHVSKIIKMIDESYINYKLNPMGTVFETKSMSEALEVIHKAHQILAPYSERIYATASFDIRKDGKDRLEGKIKSIEDKIGRVKK